MQYVRSISGSVSKTWNSINPATLSGAIDVIVVEQEDGSLACSPFHVRFGKFSLLRPSDKKVEFRVNDVRQDFAMKLGDGGEAFFVFETLDDIPEEMQTSPLVSPTTSPPLPAAASAAASVTSLQEPDFLDLSSVQGRQSRSGSGSSLQRPTTPTSLKRLGGIAPLTPLSTAADAQLPRPYSGEWTAAPMGRAHTDDILTTSSFVPSDGDPHDAEIKSMVERSNSPPMLPVKEAIKRAKSLSKQLSASNIQSHVTETGDLMLDMTGYKSSEEDALRAEVIARRILAEELDGDYDIGALIGADEQGNLWIYSSEEAKDAAAQRLALMSMVPETTLASDAASDPGYHSDEDHRRAIPIVTAHRRAGSDIDIGMVTPPQTPPDATAGDANRNYAKTLRLTSDQLKSLGLKSGSNPISFTVNRATCQANMFLWKYDDPVVISDIDGTITKSDALGHVLNMIGRDWTHAGVAKLYTEIVANGYKIMYLTSRSVGQADITRTYLNGIVQDGYKLPDGPTILSPDRTIAALRREIYLRKPEVFKMACLRDIRSLFGLDRKPFYAGFGNRLTDALSYRSVSIPSNRIFTINSNAEVVLDLLSLNTLKLSYVNMREVVDHYFPPVGTLVKGGGEEFTDFTYWRESPRDMDEFSMTDSDVEDEDDDGELSEDDVPPDMEDSFISHEALAERAAGSAGESLDGDETVDDAEYDDEDDLVVESAPVTPAAASPTRGVRDIIQDTKLSNDFNHLDIGSSHKPRRHDESEDDISPVGFFN